MFIDTHCHLNLKPFTQTAKGHQALIERARIAHVEFLINVGVDLEHSLQGLTLAKKYPSIFCAFGVHPNEAKAWDASVEDQFYNAIQRDGNGSRKLIVAIGEIGLDYFRNKTPESLQKEVFRAQLILAKRVQLPVIIHSREALDDTVRILKEEGMESVVFHCFSGTLKQAELLWKNGWYTSFTAMVTYLKNEALQAVVKACSDTGYFLETDAPFLPPQSRRGEPNEPSYMIETAQTIADLRDQSLEEVAWHSTQNAKRFFALP